MAKHPKQTFSTESSVLVIRAAFKGVRLTRDRLL